MDNEPESGTGATPGAAETVLASRRLRAVSGAAAPAATTGSSEAVSGTTDAASEGMVLKERYLLEKLLGEGGMGVVYRARDLEEQRIAGTEQFVAVKLLRGEFRDHPDSVRALFEEVRKTRELAHPNIVSVYGCQQDGAHVFMTMQLLEGKTLDVILSEDMARGVPWDRARPIIAGIGSALAYAHDRGVIHCDLKPSNIFLTLSGLPKVLDFGIARAARGARAGRFDSGSLGALTLQYASPEMIRAWRRATEEGETGGYTPKTTDDIYSFGCLVYELLAGRHPYDGRDADEAGAAGRRPRPIANISARQNAAIRRALAFAPEQRFARVEDFVGVLMRAARPAAGLAAVGAAAVVILAGAGWLFWRPASRTPPGRPSQGIATPAPPTVRAAPVAQLPSPTAATAFEFTGLQLRSLSGDERGRICGRLEQSWPAFDCSAQRICLAMRAQAIGQEAAVLQNADAADAERLIRGQRAYERLQGESCQAMQADWPGVQRMLQQH